MVVSPTGQKGYNMKTITRKSPSKLQEASATLGVGALRWIRCTDGYGYDWDFGPENDRDGRYAVDSHGNVVSLVGKPKILKHKFVGADRKTASVSLSIFGERLNISVAQLVRQVWGEEQRLPGAKAIRKDGNSHNVVVYNLQQARHWKHVRPERTDPRAGSWLLLHKEERENERSNQRRRA
jgi:hypothetical protein